MARIRGSDVFLISLKKEREVIIPLLHYHYEVARAHLKDNATQEQKRKEFLAACEANGVSLTAARNLAQRALAKKWYCLYTSDKYTYRDENGNFPAPPEDTLDLFSIITSDNPNTPRKLAKEELYEFQRINQSQDPAFNTQAKFWQAVRPALHIPEGYVVVDISTLQVLLAVLEDTEQDPGITLEHGYLAPVPSRITTPSAQVAEMLFTPERIEFLPGRKDQYIVEANGQITLFERTKDEIEELHAQVFGILWSIFLDQQESEDAQSKQTIKFYAPDFCKKAGIDPRDYSTKRDKTTPIKKQRYNAIVKKLQPLETVMGRGLDDVLYRVLTIESYNEAEEIFTVRTPFLASLIEPLVIKQIDEKHSQLNTLFHSRVVNEPSGAAFELANYILNHLLQRGFYDPDGNGIIKYETRYGTLISNCPQLKRALDTIQAKGNPATRSQAYNAKLKQTFEAAYRIIFTKSDAPQYFLNLRINGVGSWKTTETTAGGRKKPANFRIPTKTQLNDKLIITHKGKNPDYKKPLV